MVFRIDALSIYIQKWVSPSNNRSGSLHVTTSYNPETQVLTSSHYTMYVSAATVRLPNLMEARLSKTIHLSKNSWPPL